MDLNDNNNIEENKGDFETIDDDKTTSEWLGDTYKRSVDLQLEPGAFVPDHVKYKEPEQKEVYQAPPPPPFYPPQNSQQNTGAYPPNSPQYQPQPFQPSPYGYSYNQAPAPTNIYVQNTGPAPYISPLSKTTTLILCILGFVGFAGIHYFYSGKIGMGLLYFFTGGLCGIGTIIDTINIASGNFRDQYGYYIVN